MNLNFNSPYKALNIQDFWRRWHITLSRFLRDYIYIPLGGNRKSEFRTYSNLMATFIIGGIWHGAGWTFIFWGFLHGLALVIHRTWSKLGIKIWTWLAWLITFNFINITWVFFRAKEWSDAVKVLGSMFSLDNIVLPNFLSNKLALLHQYGVKFGGFLVDIGAQVNIIFWLIFGFILILFFRNSSEKVKELTFNYQNAILSGVSFVISLYMLGKGSEFLYFNF